MNVKNLLNGHPYTISFFIINHTAILGEINN